MLTVQIQELLLAHTDVSEWSQMATFVRRPIAPEARPCWEYPLLAAQAVGGSTGQATPAAAAVFCLLSSIHLVDDMLDEEAEGLHQTLGQPRTANMALAFQSLAAWAMAEAKLPSPRLAAALHLVAQAGLRTARGQELDIQPRLGEEDYWRVVDAKTPPLFSCALAIGALCGGAEPELAHDLAKVGTPLGRMVQVSDDLKDALQRPAATDWQRADNNLPIVYARHAPHQDRERFVELLALLSEATARNEAREAHESGQLHATEDLREAQSILARSGALSYCAFQIMQAHDQARGLILDLDLPCPEALLRLLQRQIAPLVGLFEAAGVEGAGELLA